MLPVQITIRDIPASPAIESVIRKRVEKLQKFYDRICSCRVVVEQPQKHKRQGKLFNVRIDLAVPKKELVVTRKENQDVYIAIRDAFDAIERQLEEHSRKRHGRVKTHDEMIRGNIARILFAEGYGFIDGADGNEYYFSTTNVNHDNFDRLCVGDAVEFIAVQQNDGWQAHRVIIKERNHVS